MIQVRDAINEIASLTVFIPNPLYSVRPLRRMMYSSMAWRISSGLMYSSAVWLRAESPGPIFRLGNGINAWSLSVGEPNGVLPNISARATTGCDALMPDGFSRVECGVSVHSGTASRSICKVSSFEYASVVRTSTSMVHLSGTTLC